MKRTVDRFRLIVLALVPLVGCGSHAPRAETAALEVRRAPAREISGGVTAPVGRAIVALPARATYAWVSPSALLNRVRRTDDERSAQPDIERLTADVSVVLRAHGWRAVPPDSAEFALTIAMIDRPDPAQSQPSTSGRTSTPLPRCKGGAGERTDSGCMGEGFDKESSRRAVGTFLVYVIKDTREGAVHAEWRSLVWDARPSDFSFVRPTLDLLLSGAP